MASKPVRFHPDADQEYLAALGWYQDRSPVAGADFERAVTNAVKTISLAPQRWPSCFERFRKYTFRHFPFSVVYEELLSEIAVYAIARGRRRRGYWTART